MNLLIVDDEIVTTQVLEEQLDRALLSIDQIYVAYNTSMARDILQKNKVELILCDIEMPKENGIHFLEWVREQIIQTEVIFLTSHEKFEYAYGAVQNGAANYLLKPIDMNKINQALLRVTEKIAWKQKTEEIREYWKIGRGERVRGVGAGVVRAPGGQGRGREGGGRGPGGAAGGRAVANYGSTRKYVFKYIGRNSRLDEIQAAVLDVKLKHLDEDVILRKAVAKYYIENIKNSLITVPVVKDWDAHVFHIFTIRCKSRDELQKYLADNGIQTIIHYPIPPHKQECYKEWNDLSFPITEQIHDEELSLPMSPVMTMDEVMKCVECINGFSL